MVQSPGAAGQADDRRSSRGGAGAGAEGAVAKALSLLPLLLDLRPRPASSSVAVGVAVQSGSSGTAGERKAAGAGSAGADATSSSGGGDEELEAVLGALLAVLRRGSASNREAALAALGSKVLPRLGGAAAGGREWLGDLIVDEELLVAAIEDRSASGAACHQRALGLTYQLLASSPELMSLALEPGCPLLPAVLDALDDGRSAGAGGDTPGSRAASIAGGVDGSASGHRRATAGTPNGAAGDGVGGAGAVVGAPGTPRSAPRTPRLVGMAGERRRSRGAAGGADGEAGGRSGLSVLRIVGLVRIARRRLFFLFCFFAKKLFILSYYSTCSRCSAGGVYVLLSVIDLLPFATCQYWLQWGDEMEAVLSGADDHRVP